MQDLSALLYVGVGCGVLGVLRFCFFFCRREDAKTGYITLCLQSGQLPFFTSMQHGKSPHIRQAIEPSDLEYLKDAIQSATEIEAFFSPRF